MKTETGMGDGSVLQGDADVRHRGLLRFGTLVTALTGASAIATIGAGGAQAAPEDPATPASYIPVTEKGSPSGVATLDANAQIPAAQLPDLSPVGGTVAAPAPSGGDDTVALQALINAGASAIRLQTGGAYLITTLLAPPRPFTLVGIASVLNATTAAPAIVKNGVNKVGMDGVRVVLLSEANKITDAIPAEQFVMGSLSVRNDRDAAVPTLDVAGFQGQAAGAANNARTVQVHHYNDNDVMWIDNVGAGAALRLNNARNITRRTDKPSNYVGTGVYVTLREMKTDGSGYMELFNINNKAEFLWTGAAGSRVGTAKFTQNKADNGQWAFSFATTKPHANVATFGNAVDLLSDTALTRSVVRSHPSKTAGLMVTTAAGSLSLGAADGNINTSGAQFTTNAETAPVKFNRPVNVRNYGPAASLPVLTEADRALASADSKLLFWNGTAWATVMTA